MSFGGGLNSSPLGTPIRIIKEDDLNFQVTQENLLGNGAFGLVIKTKYAGTPVAAKTLHMFNNPVMYGLFPDTPAYQHVIGEFNQELLTNASLTHPNIIQFVGVVTGAGNMPKWMILELGNTTLEKDLQNGILERSGFRRKLEVMIHILRGLCFMHSNNVVHRDLKPANIINVSNTYKLGDLGL